MIKGIVFVIIAIFASSSLAAQSLLSNVAEEAMSQVAQVVASDCAGSGTRSGSAFVWPDEQSVVTARHVVAGCRSVRIQFPNGPVLNAQPNRELVEQDLVILHLSGSSHRSAVRLSRSVPPTHTELVVVGYALGAPTPDDKLLTVTAGNANRSARLRDMLPGWVLQEIQQNGPWDVETEILRLDGNLVSGHSGAPLFSSDGSVVAIGAGGLQDGASGIVWAVQARYLHAAENWQSVQPWQHISRPSAFSFADQPLQRNVPTVSCGDFTLNRQRTASIAELRRGIDDVLGFEQILAQVAPAPNVASAFRFDVWVDVQSGVTIPIPAGANVVSGPSGCSVEVGQHVRINIATRRVQSLSYERRAFEIDVFSRNLELNLLEMFPLGLRPDNDFTYRAPFGRPDGFVANRKGFDASHRVGPNSIGDAYVFLAHLARGADYAGVSAVRDGAVISSDAIMRCRQSGNFEPCRRAIDPSHEWSMAVLAVHMATIPPI